MDHHDNVPSTTVEVEKPLLPPKKENKILKELNYWTRECISIFFWFYVITKVFIYDLDTYVITNFFPNCAWIIQYKLIILLLLLSAFWLLTKNSKIIGWFLYISFYPFVVFCWKIPRFFYKVGNWNLGIAFINSVLSFFQSIKYNFICTALSIVCLVVIYNTNIPFLNIGSVLVLCILLIIIFYNRFIMVFKPTVVYRIHAKITGFFLKTSKEQWALDEEVKNLSLTDMSSKQLQTWCSNLQLTVIANRACYFLSSKLSDYKKSRYGVIFNIFSVILLFLITVVFFAFINYGVFKVWPEYYATNANDKLFDFLYYSFNTIHFNNIADITPTVHLSKFIFMFEQFFALLLIGIFFTLFLSVKNDKESKEIDDVVEQIKAQGDTIGTFVESEYKLSIEDAISELGRLKVGMIKIIFYLSKGIK